MRKFKKDYSLKVISLTIGIALLSTNFTYSSQDGLRLPIGADDDTYKRIETIESHLQKPPIEDYLSLKYFPLERKEIALIMAALPAITKRKIITVKSFGIGGDGHELYQTADIILDYIEAHRIQGVKIQLIAYDKMEDKLLSAMRKIKSHLSGRLDHIEIKGVLVDFADKEKYKVLVREKADILFCRNIWIAYHNNWGFGRQKKLGNMLADNVNEGGVICIENLNVKAPSYYIKEIKTAKRGRLFFVAESVFTKKLDLKGLYKMMSCL